MESGKFVSYLRVSTARQGTSGLGLEAQRASVAGFLNGGDWTLVQEILEVESGKRNDRPALATALKLCRKHRATLVIAKLDRLARNVALISNLMESGVEFLAVDMPRRIGSLSTSWPLSLSKRPRPSRRGPKQPSPPQKCGERSLAVGASRLNGSQRLELQRVRCVVRKRARSAGSSFRPSQPYEPRARARSARSRQNSMLVRSQHLEDLGNGLRSRSRG